MPNEVEHRQTALVGDNGFAIDRNERAGSALTTSTASGNRTVKSLPWRVMSRTPVLSRRAMMRKPSCLIS